MPTLWVMELSRQLCGKMRRSKRVQPPSPPTSSLGLEIHFYISNTHQLEYLKGCYTAEELCVDAAKKCSISPLCHNLFALYNEETGMWYPPNHEFKITDETSLKLHYRFISGIGHGTTEGESPVWRHCISKLKGSPQKTQKEHPCWTLPPGLPVCSGVYLHQGQHDFQVGMVPLRVSQSDAEQHEIENECLGMAVLAITHYAMIMEIPPSAASQEIRQLNRNIKHNITPYDLKIKYLATLEGLTTGLGWELLEPKSVSCQIMETSPDVQVLVTGTTGISWRKKPSTVSETVLKTNKSKKNKHDSKQKNDKKKEVDEGWVVFCDFHEITHTVIKDSTVTIKRQDNKRMELQMMSRAEALSFAALVDGYFRLTVDAHHFLCTEVAPSSVVHNIENGCHGPICTDYAIHKLRQEGNEEGTYILRWSCTDYHYIIITVVCTEYDLRDSRPVRQFKNFQIEVAPNGYRLYGTETLRPSLKELLEHLEGQSLRTENLHFQLIRCCPPQPREVSNLMVATKDRAPVPQTPMQESQLSFHRILKEEIEQEEHLGRRTPGTSFQDVKLVLKVRGSGHRDIFPGETQTQHPLIMMRQVSHKHIVLLYGVCVRTRRVNIMVEEFVQLGPLDQFMRRQQIQLSTPWKFQVAKQLASALSYLEDKRLVHGYVCAKNILLARDGLETDEGGPFIKLSDPGIPITVLKCVHRIPWIAPECVKSVSSLNVAADKWGLVPHCGRSQKERFYETECQLATPDCKELAPTDDPLHVLPNMYLFVFSLSDPSIRPQPTPEVDPTVFERDSEKDQRSGRGKLLPGHFGKVELCRYDPRGDKTGELVAVKSLKPENREEQGNNLSTEIDILKALYHNNIVKYKAIKLIMEYLPLGSLKEYLPRYKSKTNLNTLLSYAVQICEGMDYLGSRNYIHRDLAARNVLVENERTVKIGDFGLTKSIKENEGYYTVKEDHDSPVFWYAPECLTHCKFYRASDVWSFGVTMYELITYCDSSKSPMMLFMGMIGKTHGQMTVVRLVNVLKEGRRLPRPEGCPEPVYELMRRCWEQTPERRITFRRLIEELTNMQRQLQSQNDY
uniref:Tyrosine-protein kinase n=1 Tax=Sphaeramia orbicularis TaxID=375764 RepID=A0A672Z4E9_9TELE